MNNTSKPKIIGATIATVVVTSLTLGDLTVPSGEDFFVLSGIADVNGPIEMGGANNIYKEYYSSIHQGLVSGSGNDLRGYHGYPGRGTLTFGDNNTVKAEGTISLGSGNTMTSRNSFIAGNDNDLIGGSYVGIQNSAIIGSSNILSAFSATGGTRSNTNGLVTGTSNTLQMQNSLISGINNSAIDKHRPYHNAFVFGNNNHILSPNYNSGGDRLSFLD